MGDGFAAARFGHHRHFFALDRMAAKRGVHHAGLPIRRAPDQRQIFAGERQAAAVIGEKL